MRQFSVILLNTGSQIENPLFDPTMLMVGATVGDSGSSVGVVDLPDNLQNIVEEANQPDPTPPPTLTPDGTGTVVDNIMTVNDIEFFTVTTDNGSDFFLVVDRQRTSNNVYLLNTVTEADLMALAEARGETLPPPSSSNVSSTGQPQTQETPNTPTLEEIMLAIQEAAEQNLAEQNQPPAPPVQGSNSGIIFLVVIVLVLGGGAFAVWYFVLPALKKGTQSSQDEEIEEEFEEYDDGDFNEADFVEVENSDDEFISDGGFDGEDFPSEDFEEQGGEDDD